MNVKEVYKDCWCAQVVHTLYGIVVLMLHSWHAIAPIVFYERYLSFMQKRSSSHAYIHIIFWFYYRITYNLFMFYQEGIADVSQANPYKKNQPNKEGLWRFSSSSFVWRGNPDASFSTCHCAYILLWLCFTKGGLLTFLKPIQTKELAFQNKGLLTFLKPILVWQYKSLDASFSTCHFDYHLLYVYHHKEMTYELLITSSTSNAEVEPYEYKYNSKGQSLKGLLRNHFDWNC